MRISTGSRALGTSVMAGVLGLIAAGWWTLDQVRVGGPIYSEVILYKDLIADVLPPPEYIVEAYLEVNLALDEPNKLDAHVKRLEALSKEYFDRHAYWTRQSLDLGLAALLLEDSHKPAERFWQIVQGEFLPALQGGNAAEATRVFPRVAAAYVEHRSAIDKVVAKANSVAASTEASTTSRISLSTRVMTALAVGVLLLVAAAVWLVLKRIVNPLGQINAAMTGLARGDLDLSLPKAGQDEIGEMVRATEIFRANALERASLMSDIEKSRAEAETRKHELEGLASAFLGKADKLKAILDRQAHVVRACAKRLSKSADSAEEQVRQGLSASSEHYESCALP